MTVYALLDALGGWLVDLVVWDGNFTTWQPPAETIAQLADTVDFSSLPSNPTQPPQPPEE